MGEINREDSERNSRGENSLLPRRELGAALAHDVIRLRVTAEFGMSWSWHYTNTLAKIATQEIKIVVFRTSITIFARLYIIDNILFVVIRA